MLRIATPDATRSLRKRESRPRPVFSLSFSMNIFINMRLCLLLPLLTCSLDLSAQTSQVNFLARARSFLLAANVSQSQTSSRRLLVSEEVQIDLPLTRLVPRHNIPLQRNLTALEVLTFKPIPGFKDCKSSLSQQFHKHRSTDGVQ